MIILGLTGSIGMGKSTAADMLRAMGVPVNDSDANIHLLLAKGGGAVDPVRRAFEGVVAKGAVDRAALGALVFGDADALKKLESILHPMVSRIQDSFLKQAAGRHAPLVVLDVPLLFEVGTDRRCDATVVLTAPRFLQEIRVLRRPGMTQLPDAEKRRRADFVVQTGNGRRHTLNHLRWIVTLMGQQGGANWPPSARRQRTVNDLA